MYCLERNAIRRIRIPRALQRLFNIEHSRGGLRISIGIRCFMVCARCAGSQGGCCPRRAQTQWPPTTAAIPVAACGRIATMPGKTNGSERSESLPSRSYQMVRSSNGPPVATPLRRDSFALDERAEGAARAERGTRTRLRLVSVIAAVAAACCIQSARKGQCFRVHF